MRFVNEERIPESYSLTLLPSSVCCLLRGLCKRNSPAAGSKCHTPPPPSRAPHPLCTHAGLLRYAGRLVHTRGFHPEAYLGFLLIPLESKRCSLLSQLNRRRQKREKVEPSPGGEALNLEARHERGNKKRDSEHG